MAESNVVVTVTSTVKENNVASVTLYSITNVAAVELVQSTPTQGGHGVESNDRPAQVGVQ